MTIKRIPPRHWDFAATRFRDFCKSQGLVECHEQHLRTILSACEDPTTILSFNARGQDWPHRQTGQMDLEYELLTNPSEVGYFCITTSYRQEEKPVEGRHEDAFPMFEFELKGDMAVLEQFERDMLEFMGFDPTIVQHGHYVDVAKHFKVEEITGEVESRIGRQWSDIFLLKNFPEHTDPFWNMRRNGNTANKIDVIMHGIETIGSAERSCNPEEMETRFHTISQGRYAKKLYELFGKDRVLAELREFLDLPFIVRCGGGIGATRLIRAMKLSGLIESGEQARELVTA